MMPYMCCVVCGMYQGSGATGTDDDIDSLNTNDTKNKNEPHQPVQILQDAPSKMSGTQY